MKLIKQIESALVFVSFTADKTYRSGVRLIIECQATCYQHSNKNSQGEGDGRWKFDGGVELMDLTVMVGKKVLSDVEQKAFLAGNKAAGIDYLDKTIKAINTEMEILGACKLAIQAGIKLIDNPMIQESYLQAKELGL